MFSKWDQLLAFQILLLFSLVIIMLAVWCKIDTFKQYLSILNHYVQLFLFILKLCLSCISPKVPNRQTLHLLCLHASPRPVRRYQTNSPVTEFPQVASPIWNVERSNTYKLHSAVRNSGPLKPALQSLLVLPAHPLSRTPILQPNVYFRFLPEVMPSSSNAIWSLSTDWKPSFFFQSSAYLLNHDQGLCLILPNSLHRW